MERMEIEFIIDRNGEVRMDVRGARGIACRDAVEAVKQIGDVLHETRKPEFYARAPSTLVVRQSSGSETS